MSTDTTETPDGLGRLGAATTADDGTSILRFERHLPHPPDKVWRALTESDQLHHWFPSDIVGERAVGAKLEFRFWPESVDRASDELTEVGVDLEDPVLYGEMLAWEPPALLEFTWDSDHVRFELSPEANGTKLIFTTRLLGSAGPHGVSGTLAGYHVCFDCLAELLGTGTATTPPPCEIEALESRYAASLT